MLFESALAYFHFLAFLSLTVFVASQAALCRAEWINAASVRRLGVLDRWVVIFSVVTLCSGLARVIWGIKGAQWMWGQPLLHVKITLFAFMCVLGAIVHLRIELEATGALPDAAALNRTRRLVMVQAHVMTLIPIAAVMLARGIWVR